MQKNIPLYLVKYYCISCQAEYQNYSTIQENKKINICANCSPVYKGKATAEIKIGRVKKFHQRQQKTLEKQGNK